MNTGSVIKTLCWLAFIATLAACSAPAKRSFVSDRPPSGSVSNSELRQASLAKGRVVISAPRGYCIAPDTIRFSSEDDFVLIARCDMVGANGFFASREPALISVMVGRRPDASQPTLADLERLATTEDILDRRPDSDPPMIRLRSAEPGIDGASPQHWRAAFSVNGHLVALALYAPEGSSTQASRGARLLTELTRETRASSQLPTQPVPPALRGSKKASSLRPLLRPHSAGNRAATGGKIIALFD
ncbi:hypothetical protein QEZ52_19435 [Aliisedimentitalea scapharcae]|uniref:Dihydroxy-acid dehydratase n=1 Tax=Aliisedimentitalea scapharcae TaxID=1524259 RepID=A0ABZ2XRK6_9RHOB